MTREKKSRVQTAPSLQKGCWFDPRSWSKTKFVIDSWALYFLSYCLTANFKVVFAALCDVPVQLGKETWKQRNERELKSQQTLKSFRSDFLLQSLARQRALRGGPTLPPPLGTVQTECGQCCQLELCQIKNCDFKALESSWITSDILLFTLFQSLLKEISYWSQEGSSILQCE